MKQSKRQLNLFVVTYVILRHKSYYTNIGMVIIRPIVVFEVLAAKFSVVSFITHALGLNGYVLSKIMAMHFLYQFLIERYSRSISQHGINTTTWAERCFPIIHSTSVGRHRLVAQARIGIYTAMVVERLQAV